MAGTLALALGFLLLLAWDLRSIQRDLATGRSRLDALTLDAAASTGVTGLADDAERHLRQAADRTRSSLPLRALGLVPLVEDQVAGMRRMADATATLGTAAATSAERLDGRLDAAGEPKGRTELLGAALAELDALETAIAGVDLGPAEGLVPPLRRAHDELTEALADAREKIEDGRALIAPVRRVLEGPTSLLLLAANNAEMTGGAGMSLSAGILTFAGGDFQLSQIVPASVARLEAALPIPDRIRSIYGPTGVGIDLRSTTRSPDLATMGPIALDIMAQHGFPDLAGVVVVDALALRDLMELTGPVTVAGREIGADTVLAEVLHDNYVAFDTYDEREERAGYQGDIAKAVFETLTSSDVSPIDLAEALLTTSEGRHLMLWAPDPDLQAVWEEVGVAGDLHPLGLMVSFQNYAADKLDWYLRPTADLDVRLLPSGDYRATLTMRLPVPSREEMPDASGYILGPSPEKHGVFLTVHVPGNAYDITTPDAGGFRTSGREPPMQVRSFLVDVPLGTTLERTIEFSLPREVPWMLLLPSARVHPLEVTVDGVATTDDALPRALTWLAAHPPAEGERSASPWVRVPVVAGLLATLVATAALALTAARHRVLAGPFPTVVPAAAAGALACFLLAATIAMLLAWTGPRL